jgi:hypothetical protein
MNHVEYNLAIEFREWAADESKYNFFKWYNPNIKPLEEIAFEVEIELHMVHLEFAEMFIAFKGYCDSTIQEYWDKVFTEFLEDKYEISNTICDVEKFLSIFPEYDNITIFKA